MSLAAMALDAAATPGLHVARLSLSQFRCYAGLRLELAEAGSAPVVLVGANGAGKTNVLEALSYLAPGRGLRGARLDEVTRFGAEGGWAVHARVMLDGRVTEIGTGLTAGQNGNQRRVVRIDGETVSGPAALGRGMAMLWLTPAMDRLFTEGAGGRRRFLDRIVVALYGDHGRQVAGFERAMRERNRLLGERGAGGDPGWLAALENRMAEHAVAVAAARREAVSRLDRRSLDEPASPFPRPRVAVSGWLEDMLAGASALEVEDAYRERLAAMRGEDAAAGRTLEGPHRSDMAVRHGESDMPAHLCSTGEQKGLLVALILAHAGLIADQAGMAPILLLDEIAAHLDETRRAALFTRLIDLNGQAWLTGTEPGLFSALSGHAAAFSVSEGAVHEASL